MKKFTILFFLLCASCLLLAQQSPPHATDQNSTGKISFHHIHTNPHAFTKDKKASYLLKSDRMNVGFWINPEKWSFNKAVYDNKAEYELQLKGHQLYATIMTDTVQTPFSAIVRTELKEIASVAPHAKVVTKEFRKVNGLQVLCLFLEGNVKGKDVSFYGYYFSAPGGTVQFIAYTSEKKMKRNQKICEHLLNGIVLTKNPDPGLMYHHDVKPMLISHL